MSGQPIGVALKANIIGLLNDVSHAQKTVARPPRHVAFKTVLAVADPTGQTIGNPLYKQSKTVTPPSVLIPSRRDSSPSDSPNKTAKTFQTPNLSSPYRRSSLSTKIKKSRSRVHTLSATTPLRWASLDG